MSSFLIDLNSGETVLLLDYGEMGRSLNQLLSFAKTICLTRYYRCIILEAAIPADGAAVIADVALFACITHSNKWYTTSILYFLNFVAKDERSFIAIKN